MSLAEGSDGFGATSNAMEVVRDADLRGKVALVTGASSGLGLETARALAAAGADLILGVRDAGAGEAVAERLRRESGRSVIVDRIDLTDFPSVVEFATRRTGPLDILVANAGASITPQTHQTDGIDVRFAGNHLGHFLLANLLHAAMRQRGARIVMLSSAAHKGKPIHLDDLLWQARPHDVFAAYGESKTANILFAMEATRRWADARIFANAVLPGSVLTGLQRYHGDEVLRSIGFTDEHGRPNPILKTVEQGAATTVWAATAKALDDRGGVVLEDCREARPYSVDMHPWTGFDPEVLDDASARRLWEASLDILADCGVRW
jgi:NAD(P)-dependent dehydrogenase (short-subunit alcohol dehydrogenase family)